MKKTNKKEKTKIKKILMVLLTASSLAACGGGDGPSKETVKAAKGVMAVVMQNSASGDIQLQALTTNFDQSEKVVLPCSSGSADVSQSVKGSVTTDDQSEEVTSVNLDVVSDVVLNKCAPANMTSTKDVDESTFVLDGTIGEKAKVNGSEENPYFSVSQTGNIRISGACEGSLQFEVTLKGSDKVCTSTGTVSGTICGERVNSEVSGNCGNPSLSEDTFGEEDDENAKDKAKDKKDDDDDDSKK
ncbi:MAG: hypothetical protein HYS22_00035 [Deltaproteobacteria bacterium]|nr:hypothetical protein [Deltaproteobacteria bacterium]